jgi:hypothetical protein
VISTQPWYPDRWGLLSPKHCTTPMFVWDFLIWLLPSSVSEVRLIGGLTVVTLSINNFTWYHWMSIAAVALSSNELVWRLTTARRWYQMVTVITSEDVISLKSIATEGHNSNRWRCDIIQVHCYWRSQLWRMVLWHHQGAQSLHKRFVVVKV